METILFLVSMVMAQAVTLVLSIVRRGRIAKIIGFLLVGIVGFAACIAYDSVYATEHKTIYLIFALIIACITTGYLCASIELMASRIKGSLDLNF